MIHLFCSEDIYSSSCKYVDDLLNNHTFLKLYKFNNENEIKDIISNNNLLYKNIIFIENIDEYSLKRLSTINLNNNIYILNITKLLKTINYSYLLSYNINILDSNLHNIELIKEYSNVKYISEYINENFIVESKNRIFDI